MTRNGCPSSVGAGIEQQTDVGMHELREDGGARRVNRRSKSPFAAGANQLDRHLLLIRLVVARSEAAPHPCRRGRSRERYDRVRCEAARGGGAADGLIDLPQRRVLKESTGHAIGFEQRDNLAVQLRIASENWLEVTIHFNWREVRASSKAALICCQRSGRIAINRPVA